MTWSIHIPHRSRDEPLVDVASHCRKLGQDDARVMRQIVISAQIDSGFTSAGELLDHLEGLEPAERRVLLDEARKACDLEPTGAVDARRRTETEITRVHLDPGLQVCHAAGCSAMPLTETDAWKSVNCRAWYCEEHRAGHEDDMRDLGSGIRLSPSGVPIPDIPAEDEREAAAAESHRARQRRKDADRAVDAAAHAAHEQAKREQLHRELPEHLRNAI